MFWACKIVRKIILKRKTEIIKEANIIKEKPTPKTKLVADKEKLIISKEQKIVFFPFTAGFMLVLLISTFIDTSGLTINYESLFPQVINSAVMLITCFVVAIVVAVEFIDMRMFQEGERKEDLRGLKEVKGWYVRLFLGRSILMIILIEVGINNGFD